MKKLNLTTLLILCCLTQSCKPKTEKKLPLIHNNNNQNYKFDDDEIIKRNTKPFKNKKHNLEKV